MTGKTFTAHAVSPAHYSSLGLCWKRSIEPFWRPQNSPLSAMSEDIFPVPDNENLAILLIFINIREHPCPLPALCLWRLDVGYKLALLCYSWLRVILKWFHKCIFPEAVMRAHVFLCFFFYFLSLLYNTHSFLLCVCLLNIFPTTFTVKSLLPPPGVILIHYIKIPFQGSNF